MKSEQEIREEIVNQVESGTPAYIIDIIVSQKTRIEESRQRIAEEGILVKDMKGSILQHPAIKIEADAGKIVSELLLKYCKQPSGNP